MVQFSNLITFILGLYVMLRVLKPVMKGRINAYSIFTIAFFVFHFPSLIIDILPNTHIEAAFDPNSILYKSLTDEIIAFIYNAVILFVLFYLYKESRCQSYNFFNSITAKFKKIQFPAIVNIILIIGMAIPIACVFFAPNPEIYKIWAYTYRYNISYIDEIYNTLVMGNALTLSFLCMIIYAVQKKKSNLLIYFFIFVITWLSFKRTLLVFSVLVLLFFDFFKGKFRENAKKTILKSISLILICIGYFIYYSQHTGKLSDAPFYYSYTLYYSRHYCIKASVLDQLKGMSMLHYRGESLLFDLMFFIPRSIWPNKPSVYTVYFSNFCQGRDIDAQTMVFYYANIWSEFISNFHLFGILFALMFIKLIMRISEKSPNIYSYLFGVLFITFYFFWGIQPFTMMVIVLWVLCLIAGMFKRKKALK